MVPPPYTLGSCSINQTETVSETPTHTSGVRLRGHRSLDKAVYRPVAGGATSPHMCAMSTGGLIAGTVTVKHKNGSVAIDLLSNFYCRTLNTSHIMRKMVSTDEGNALPCVFILYVRLSVSPHGFYAVQLLVC